MPAKLTHDIVKQFYIDEKWELLEDVYINNYTKMKCKCPNGHVQYKQFGDFKNGSRCPTCSGCQKPTIEFIKEFALKDGTVCKSNKYINNKTKLLFECSNGHDYKMTWDHFNKGHRCSICSGVKKYNIEDIRFLYKDKNWILLENIYINNKTPMRCICPNGHEQTKTFNNFINESGCSVCSKKQKQTIKNIKNFASQDGTICKSNEYINGKTKLLFECPYGHEYKMIWNSFQQGRRCRVCKSINHSGNKNPNWNPNREELLLNDRLRHKRSKNWIRNYMKHDSNYNDFVYNPKNYHLDHIIPVKLFCELVSKYNLDETKIRKIINKVDNLQLLTIEENYKKKDKGDINEAKQYLIEHGIQLE